LSPSALASIPSKRPTNSRYASFAMRNSEVRRWRSVRREDISFVNSTPFQWKEIFRAKIWCTMGIETPGLNSSPLQVGLQHRHSRPAARLARLRPFFAG